MKEEERQQRDECRICLLASLYDIGASDSMGASAFSLPFRLPLKLLGALP